MKKKFKFKKHLTSECIPKKKRVFRIVSFEGLETPFPFNPRDPKSVEKFKESEYWYEPTNEKDFK